MERRAERFRGVRGVAARAGHDRDDAGDVRAFDRCERDLGADCDAWRSLSPCLPSALGSAGERLDASELCAEISQHRQRDVRVPAGEPQERVPGKHDDVELVRRDDGR